jgi:hypothetical protein
METEPDEETGDSANQGSPEPIQESPESRLRDLRPEKDPIGAGRKRFPDGKAQHP